MEMPHKKLRLAKRDFSLLLSAVLMVATFLLAFYIFTRKAPDYSDKNANNVSQSLQNIEPIVSTKTLPSPDSNLEFISDKLSETKQNLRMKKTAVAFHNLERIKATTSRLIENETKSNLKDLLRFVLSEIEVIEHYIHLGEIEEALKHTQKLEQRIETE